MYTSNVFLWRSNQPVRATSAAICQHSDAKVSGSASGKYKLQTMTKRDEPGSARPSRMPKLSTRVGAHQAQGKAHTTSPVEFKKLETIWPIDPGRRIYPLSLQVFAVDAICFMAKRCPENFRDGPSDPHTAGLDGKAMYYHILSRIVDRNSFFLRSLKKTSRHESIDFRPGSLQCFQNSARISRKTSYPGINFSPQDRFPRLREPQGKNLVFGRIRSSRP